MLGQSFFIDFLLHLGMGIAAASTLIVAAMKPTFIHTKAIAPWAKNVFNAIAALFFIGTQIALVAFMSVAKGTAVTNSIMGYVVGAAGLLGVAWLSRRKSSESWRWK